jgi:acetyl-CoA synthetase
VTPSKGDGSAFLKLKEEAATDPEAFWNRAAEQLPRFQPWERVFEWEPPTFRWYIGGKTNLGYNCVDRQVEAGRGAQAALVALDERGGRRVYTYGQLLSEVQKITASLRGLGIGEGTA